MNLESELDGPVTMEDNELIGPQGVENINETETIIKDNGHVEHVGDNKLSDDVRVEGNIGNSASSTGPLQAGSVGSSPQPVTKGRGLRKWRRKPRGAAKETRSSLDNNKKRGLTALPGETKQKSNGSSSSTNAMVNLLGTSLDFSVLYGDSGLGGGPDFTTMADSEYSEDRNSRSSTAASAPRAKHEVLPVVGLGLDENVMRSLSGNNSGILVEPGGQQEKGRVGAGKKARGIETRKEDSRSSVESDSRSSNFVFLQGTNTVTSNGRQSGRSANYDEEYSDDARNGEKYLNKEAQTASSKNEAESKDVSQEDLAAENSWDVKEEKVDNHVGSKDQDALVESIKILHSAQEALQREVEKLRDVGKEDPLFSNDSVPQSVDPQGHEPSSSDTLETQMMGLKQNVPHLQSKLEVAQATLDLKEAKVELESTLNLGITNTKLEELFKHEIEAEVEYIVISQTIQNFMTGPIDEIKLMVREQNQESKAVASKGLAEKLEPEDVQKLQKGVCRYASCFTFQSILLLVVVYLFVLQSSSPAMEVVPT